MLRPGIKLYLAVVIAVFSTSCSPDDTERLYEIREKGLSILQKQVASKAHAPISALFDGLGDGVCLSRGNPSLRQLEKKSPQEFHQVIPLLEKYRQERKGGASWSETYTLFLVTYDQVLESIDIPDGSTMVVVSGEGCHRSSESALISDSDGVGPIGIKFGLSQ